MTSFKNEGKGGVNLKGEGVKHMWEVRVDRLKDIEGGGGGSNKGAGF